MKSFNNYIAAYVNNIVKREVYRIRGAQPVVSGLITKGLISGRFIIMVVGSVIVLKSAEKKAFFYPSIISVHFEYFLTFASIHYA